MKPTIVKAWPELVDFLPALPAFTDPRRTTIRNNQPVEVDFSSIRSVSSVGLTVFILQLLRLVGSTRPITIRQCSHSISTKLSGLGTFDILTELTGPYQQELPSGNEAYPSRVLTSPGTRNLPIYCLRFNSAEDRRNEAKMFVAWLSEHSFELVKDLRIAINGLLMLLNEIAKNSADHSDADALFGIDVSPVDHSMFRLTFVFGDLGKGIKKNIQSHMLPEEKSKRLAHMSLYEAYRLAVKPGYTSKPRSRVNKGHGMSIIIDAATDLGIHLSVFDAWSRGILSAVPDVEMPTHQAIRRIFHNLGHDVAFFYYGETFLKRRST